MLSLKRSTLLKVGIIAYSKEIIILQPLLSADNIEKMLYSINIKTEFLKPFNAQAQVTEFFSQSQGGRNNSKKSLIVFLSNNYDNNVIQEYKLLQENGISILVIGVGNISKDYLLEVAGNKRTTFHINEIINMSSGSKKFSVTDALTKGTF